jgi:UDP-glucose 4-epimerase
VYGSQSELVDEDCPESDLKPQSPYAESKLNGENLLHKLQDLDYIICRFGTICGISEGMRFHTAVNKFCWNAVMKQPIPVWSTALHQKRPYLTLTDAVNALLFIIQRNLFDKRVYNIVTDNLTVNDIINFIKEYISELEIKLVDTKIMNQLSYKVSSKRFEEQGFNTHTLIKDSISDTIKLLKN